MPQQIQHPKRARLVKSHINMPGWLEPKLRPLLDRAETKERFLARIGENWPSTSTSYRLIGGAYDAAQRTFRAKKRDSGDGYFAAHLRASALFALVHLRVRDPDILSAILLHDNIEDFPDEWNFERIVAEFNKEIAELVYWVTKPSSNGGTLTDAEVDRRYHRRLMRAPRAAMFVKLPERLHNIITIWSQPEDKIRRKISETQDFIVPLTEMHHILIHEFEDVLKCAEETLEGRLC